ncbi:MAG: molecular chaperone DjiA [Ancalomicrobiaceae bacterium]|nr:molecular chaperone DjiA [Ancalomicrobiaceae bacterium]
MTLWSEIRSFLSETSQALGITSCIERAFDRLGRIGREPNDVTFTVALIALSAKMAKADGIVTDDEIGAFRRVIDVPPEEERNVARLFDLAKADIAGFETYAGRIARIVEGDAAFLASVLDGLFHIAAADGYIHEAELAFLQRVATIFGIVGSGFERILSRHVRRRRSDPYAILGIDSDAEDDEIRKHWKELVRRTHPDAHRSNARSQAELDEMSDRLAAINSAWDEIRAERGLH